MSYVALNVTGLGLDALGIVLLFFYGPPPGVQPAGTLLLWGKDEVQERKNKRNALIGRCALGIIVLGFLLQILANLKYSL